MEPPKLIPLKALQFVIEHGINSGNLQLILKASHLCFTRCCAVAPLGRSQRRLLSWLLHLLSLRWFEALHENGHGNEHSIYFPWNHIIPHPNFVASLLFVSLQVYFGSSWRQVTNIGIICQILRHIGTWLQLWQRHAVRPGRWTHCPRTPQGGFPGLATARGRLLRRADHWSAMAKFQALRNLSCLDSARCDSWISKNLQHDSRIPVRTASDSIGDHGWSGATGAMAPSSFQALVSRLTNDTQTLQNAVTWSTCPGLSILSLLCRDGTITFGLVIWYMYTVYIYIYMPYTWDRVRGLIIFFFPVSLVNYGFCMFLPFGVQNSYLMRFY